MTRVLLLLAGFAASVGLRSVVGGDRVTQSLVAGLVFAGCLVVLSFAVRTRVTVSLRALGYGMGGAAVICLPVSLAHLLSFRPLHGTQGFALWACVVVVVATAEEVFLRGALHDAVAARAGSWAAIGVGAVCFALLHQPLYGWDAVPLDLAVGVVLGWLRTASGTPASPAVAHVGADLVGWFVR